MSVPLLFILTGDGKLVHGGHLRDTHISWGSLTVHPSARRLVSSDLWPPLHTSAFQGVERIEREKRKKEGNSRRLRLIGENTTQPASPPPPSSPTTSPIVKALAALNWGIKRYQPDSPSKEPPRFPSAFSKEQKRKAPCHIYDLVAVSRKPKLMVVV